MASARTLLVAASLGTALGFAIGAAFGLRRAPADAPPVAASGAGSVAPTAAPLDAQVRELEAEAAHWRDAYEQLARSVAGDAGSGGTAGVGGSSEPDAQDAGSPTPGAPAAAASLFDESALLERGYTDEEARRLRERYEAYQLQLLYLNDRAQREGWRQTPRYHKEARQLAEALQTDVGDRDYDAVLFAAGRTNRVLVAGVITGSAAERAGLRAGDELVSYDGKNIFDSQTIVSATTQGSAGADTELRVRRGDDELRFLLPRGPIGIALEPTRVPPEGFP